MDNLQTVALNGSMSTTATVAASPSGITTVKFVIPPSDVGKTATLTIWFGGTDPGVANIGFDDKALQFGVPDHATSTSSAEGQTNYLIDARLPYAMSYNDTTHEANYVAYELNAANIGNLARSTNFQTDVGLPSAFTQIPGTKADNFPGYTRGNCFPTKTAATRSSTKARPC